MKNLKLTGIVATLNILVAVTLWANVAFANNSGQMIRGVVRDLDSKSPLIGANVVVLNTGPFLGTSTDFNGNFSLENVPVGRVDLKISYIGYEDKYINNLVVTAGKQVILEIELIENL
jgi:hypothetical protein